MALPISIGDVVLLSKLAYRLGRTLIVDRKSAPSAAKEVQNQLFSIATALSAVATCIDLEKQTSNTGNIAYDVDPGVNSEGNEVGANAISKVLRHCRETLTRMQNKINKHESILPEGNGDDVELSRSLWQNLKKNWKKVRWTMQTDELEGIRKDLNMHIASLDLILAGKTYDQTHNIKGTLGEVHTMMSEEHDWFSKTIKEAGDFPLEGRFTATPPPSSVVRNSLKSPDFRLSAGLSIHDEPILLCPRASFTEHWTEYLDIKSRRTAELFECHCQQTNTDRSGAIHSKEIKFSLLSISLIVRLCKCTPTWQIFCASSKVTSLIITEVSPEDLASFQHQIDLLGAAQSNRSVATMTNSASIFYSRGRKATTVTVLDMKSELAHFRGQISSLAFFSDETHFTQQMIDTIQFLHYRTGELVNKDMYSETGDVDLLHEGQVELVLHRPAYAMETGRITIKLDRTTTFASANNSDTVQILHVKCESEDADGVKESVYCEKVEVSCITAAAAQRFLTTLKAAKHQLQAQYVQFPRAGEQVVASKFCADMMINHMYLTGPRATIVFDPKTKLLRLILLDNSLSTAITFESFRTFYLETSQEGTEINVGWGPLPQALLGTRIGALTWLSQLEE